MKLLILSGMAILGGILSCEASRPSQESQHELHSSHGWGSNEHRHSIEDQSSVEDDPRRGSPNSGGGRHQQWGRDASGPNNDRRNEGLQNYDVRRGQTDRPEQQQNRRGPSNFVERQQQTGENSYQQVNDDHHRHSSEEHDHMTCGSRVARHKDGQCPTKRTLARPCYECKDTCRSDADCQGMAVCCHNASCGNHCINPGA